MRHHDIEEHEVRIRGLDELESGAAVGGRDDVLAAGCKNGLEQAQVFGDVVHDEDPRVAVAAHRPRPSQ
jgi:hypothetical protein